MCLEYTHIHTFDKWSVKHDCSSYVWAVGEPRNETQMVSQTIRAVPQDQDGKSLVWYIRLLEMYQSLSQSWKLNTPKIQAPGCWIGKVILKTQAEQLRQNERIQTCFRRTAVIERCRKRLLG